MNEEIEFEPMNMTITGTATFTVRGPDGKIKHIESMEVKPE